MSAQRETVADERKPVAIRSTEDELPSDLYAACVALGRHATGGKKDVGTERRNAIDEMLRADIKSVLR
jgi:hypothetical protein